MNKIISFVGIFSLLLAFGVFGMQVAKRYFITTEIVEILANQSNGVDGYNVKYSDGSVVWKEKIKFESISRPISNDEFMLLNKMIPTEEHITLEHFNPDSVPEQDRVVAYPFYNLARQAFVGLLDSSEKQEGLKKLLEARNHFINAL
jgi:hypothetical protein